MKPPSTSFNPWPYAIIAFFVVAIIGIVAFVIFASHQRMELVRPDYYEEEMTYQNQFDRLDRTRAVESRVAVTYDAALHSIKIALPAEHAGPATAGRIHFYRPSDASLDHDLRLALDAQGVQEVDARALKTGLWKLRLYWAVDGHEYFFDQAVVVRSHAS